jgi:hypothetical protein
MNRKPKAIPKLQATHRFHPRTSPSVRKTPRARRQNRAKTVRKPWQTVPTPQANAWRGADAQRGTQGTCQRRTAAQQHEENALHRCTPHHRLWRRSGGGVDHSRVRALCWGRWASTLPCYAVLCYAMLCCAIWYGMLWYAMVWYGMLWYGMLWYAMLWYAMLWYAMVCYGAAPWRSRAAAARTGMRRTSRAAARPPGPGRSRRGAG